MRTALRLIPVLACTVLVLALAPSHRTPLPKRWTEVRAGWLFRSAQIPAASAAAVLRDQQIGLVIDLTDDDADPDFAAEAQAAQALGVHYLHAPVTAIEADAVVSFAHAVAAIAKAHARGERVLVHCELGYRRSAAAIALYARLIEREPPEIAYHELYRYADALAGWQTVLQQVLERNVPELEARVAAELSE